MNADNSGRCNIMCSIINHNTSWSFEISYSYTSSVVLLFFISICIVFIQSIYRLEIINEEVNYTNATIFSENFVVYWIDNVTPDLISVCAMVCQIFTYLPRQVVTIYKGKIASFVCEVPNNLIQTRLRFYIPSKIW